MAQGDVTVFSAAKRNIGDGLINLSTGTFKMSLITAAVTPTENDADPRGVGTAGSPDYTEVTAGGNYAAGGATLAMADKWTLTGNACKFDADDVSWAQHASNPTNARWAIIYQDDANDYAVCFVDLGSVFDMSGGALDIAWNASGIFTLA